MTVYKNRVVYFDDVCILFSLFLYHHYGQESCVVSTALTGWSLGKSWVFHSTDYLYVLFFVMTPCILVGITTCKTLGALNYLSCVHLQYWSYSTI
jgi:hypothetical protein